MKRTLALLLWMCMSPAIIWAQKITVSGTVKDASSEESLPGASVVLLTKKDSSQVVGASSDLEGKFTLPTVKAGSYIMRVSFVGYQTQYKDLTLSKKNTTLNVGAVSLLEDSKMLSEAEVVAKLAQMEMKADTFIYNADAFRMPEGSSLEELIKKLPGAEIDDDGNIKINGKTVSKILVEGKEFFEGDNKMTTKNLTSKMIKKLKAYDKKSDYSRITGIDDGEEQTVLDLTLQSGMKEGWMINTNVGYGSEDRYSGQFMIGRFLDHAQFAVIGSSNNTNDQGFPGGGRGGWGGGGGIVSSQMAGANFSWDNGRPEYTAGIVKTGGHIFYNHRRNTAFSTSNSEMFLSNVNSTFSNNMNHSVNESANVDTRLRFEWMPDSMTNLMFHPHFSHNESHGHSESQSVTFNSNPYDFMSDPLAQYNLSEFQAVRDSIAVNDNDRMSKSRSNSNNVDGWFQVNRRLGKPGRNLTFDGSASYSKNENTNFSRSEINYFRQHRSDFTNQYIPSPSTNYNGSGRLSYSEPIIGALNVQFSYRYQYRYSDSDRSMYSIDSLLTKYPGAYTAEQLYLGYLPGLDSLDYVRNLENSQYATYRENNHEANVMLRYNVGENRLNVGVSFQPQTTHMDYAKNLLDTTVVRHTFNWAPRIDYRWKFSNAGQLRVRFNGRMSQPGITSLLEVTDSSDPLNISMGNSGLRSSWNNDFNVFYNDYRSEKQMGWSVNASFDQTKNSISTATIYNTSTGARYSRPMNIDGNWNTWGNVNFNSALGPKKFFNINTNTNLSHNHRVGYMSSNSDGTSWGSIYKPDGSINMEAIFRNTPLNKSITRSTNMGEWVRLNYRNDFMEVGVNGGFNYSHSRNDVQENANLDTWSFNYGGNLIFNAPWGTSFSTDISQQSRRGYDDASMNTNELIWNAQLSQNFLKNRAATISVQWYDILRERSNISRNISAISRTDSWSNAIHSYVMVRFMYRLNLMGNKQARAQGGWGGGGGWGGHGGWGGRGGGGRW